MSAMKEHESQIRVFFALWPNEAERTALAAWQTLLRAQCGGREMRIDTLHATLVFLGEVVEHRLETLKLAAQEVAGDAFELNLDQARYWGHNHIAFAAPSMTPAPLSELVHDLEQRLRAHRFRFDQRDYKPHVTLLRHAKWTDEPLPKMPPVDWQVHDFVLVSSLRDEQGAHYEVLTRFPLASRQMI